MSVDYDLYVLNPENQNTLEYQKWDCVYDALWVLYDRLEKEEEVSKMILGRLVRLEKEMGLTYNPDLQKECVRSLMDDLMQKVMKWGEEKGLNDPKAQLNKVLEEVGEIAHEITRNNYDSPELVDAIGDSLVTIIILSNILHIHPAAALETAWNAIENRKGKTIDGTFVKEQ